MDKFTSNDKLEVATYLRDAGFDMTSGFIGDTISQVEKYWRVRKFLPSDNPIPKAVKEYVAHPGGNGYIMLLNDGEMHPVGQQLFDMENQYNFLPDRYRTFIPNLANTLVPAVPKTI